jgi:hypothetical protein
MMERNTKTRTGIDIKKSELYRSKRPNKYCNPDDPFYIQQNNNPEKSALWFKSQPVGVNKVSKFMKTIATNSGDYSVHVLYIYKFNIYSFFASI